MQSVSAADIEAGENYLSIMERNLEALEEALPGTWR
jgi:ABC-type Zn uptake system ZnuABC Zn-binding protein ZnuA